MVLLFIYKITIKIKIGIERNINSSKIIESEFDNDLNSPKSRKNQV